VTLLDRLFDPARLRLISRAWLIAAACTFAAHLWLQTARGMTDGAGHPFGDDTLNFWSAARLAVLGRIDEIYDLLKFHEFEMLQVGHTIDFYHYSYPPVMVLLSLPLGLLPFQVGWAAWLGLGWLAFALCLRRMRCVEWMLLSSAWPAVYISFMSGQNGLWVAAIFGWGLLAMPQRPFLAGLILSLLAFKPQLAILVPVALVAAAAWRTIAGLACGGAALLAATNALCGTGIWSAYLRQADTLRSEILEQGEGVWHRMISMFVLLRHLGLTSRSAYLGQAAFTLVIAICVALVWRACASQDIKNAALVLGALLASPYVSDYDLVAVAFVPLWFAQAGVLSSAPARTASVLAAAAALVAAPFATITGAAAAGLMLGPGLAVAMRAAASSRPPRAG
jgi:hypothetical protein